MSSTSQSSWQSGITRGKDQDAGTGTGTGTDAGAGGTPELSTIFKSVRHLAIQNFPMKET